MGQHYTDDVRAGGPTQLHPNDAEGGILIFDCNEVIAEMEEHGESHQLHLCRPLTEAELNEFERLNNRSATVEDESDNGRAEGPGIIWLDCGDINQEARTYLLSLKAVG